MDLRKLRHAVLLADEGSFSRASGIANLTQPALSRSIQTLEQELGVILFERSSSGVSPTATGAHIVALARNLLRDASNLRQEADMLRTGDAGRICFGIGPMLAPILAPLLSDVVRDHPALEIEIELDAVHRLLEPLRADRIDFCIAAVEALIHQSDLEVRSVARWPFGYFVRAGHPLAEIDVTTQALADYPLLSSRFPSWPDLPSTSSMTQISWRGHVFCADGRTLKEIALDSDGVLLAMGPSVEPEFAAGSLKRLRYAPDREWQTTVGIATRRGRPQTPAAQRIAAGLEEALSRYGAILPVAE